MVELLEPLVEAEYPDSQIFDVDAFLKQEGIFLNPPPRSYLFRPQMLLAFQTFNRVSGLPVQSNSRDAVMAAIKGRYGRGFVEANCVVVQENGGLTLEGSVINLTVGFLAPWPEGMGMKSPYFDSIYYALCSGLRFNSGFHHTLEVGYALPIGDCEPPSRLIEPLNPRMAASNL